MFKFPFLCLLEKRVNNKHDYTKMGFLLGLFLYSESQKTSIGSIIFQNVDTLMGLLLDYQ